MKKSIEDLKVKESEKYLEVKELNDRLSDASDESKPSINDRISKVKDQINDIKSKTNDKKKGLPELEKEHEERMIKIKSDMENWIEKIQ